MASEPDFKQLLAEGLTDAGGFVAGGLLAFAATQWLGLDIFAPGYGNAAMAGILMLGAGGGVGVFVARRWRQRALAARTEK